MSKIFLFLHITQIKFDLIEELIPCLNSEHQYVTMRCIECIEMPC